MGIDKILDAFDRHHQDPEVDRSETIIERTCKDCGIKPFRLCIALISRIDNPVGSAFIRRKH